MLRKKTKKKKKKKQKAASPALSNAAGDPVQSAQDDQHESTQERPPTPREAAGSSANANPAQNNNAHALIQPIPRQVDVASPSQQSTGTKREKTHRIYYAGITH